MLQDLHPTMKIIVVGNGGVGKTTLTIKFAKNIFTQNYKKTLGVDFLNAKRYIKKLNEEIEFYIWDTAGQDYYDSITRRYYKGADAALIVFAINDKVSFDSVQNWLNKIKQECVENIPIALVMSKIDLMNEAKVTISEAEKLALNLNLFFYKISSKEGRGVNEVFEKLAIEFFGNPSKYVASPIDSIENIKEQSRGIKVKKVENDDDIEEIPCEEKKDNIKEDKNIEPGINTFKLGSIKNININADSKTKKKNKQKCC